MLKQVEVRNVWGVGCRWAGWLNAQMIMTALDLKRADPKAIPRPDDGCGRADCVRTEWRSLP
jgi:hypothetical protein